MMVRKVVGRGTIGLRNGRGEQTIRWQRATTFKTKGEMARKASVTLHGDCKADNCEEKTVDKVTRGLRDNNGTLEPENSVVGSVRGLSYVASV